MSLKGKSFQERVKESKLKNKLYFLLAAIAVVLFCLWTSYYALLILLFLFFDIYITKYVPWGKWKESKNPFVRGILGWVDAILFALVGVYIINTFFFQNYQIPSSSLEKTLLVGDFLCVSKVAYGTRSPMTPLSLPLMQHTIPVLDKKSYLEKPQLDYKRFKGSGEVKRNDIVVFNYPAGDTVALKRQNEDYYTMVYRYGRDVVWNDKENFGDIVFRPTDRRENYVKRCVGLPGDTIAFINDDVYIDGKKMDRPKFMQLQYVVQTDGTQFNVKMLEELGMSNEDIAKIFPETLTMTSAEQVERYKNNGFDVEIGKTSILYLQVNLTQEMVDQLSNKPFVKAIMTQNQFLNIFKSLYNTSSNLVYPLSYFGNKDVAYGYFPPLWIPKRGEKIVFDKDIDYKVAAYGRCIKNYEHNDFEYKDGKVYINGQEAKEYVFQLDYYFMSGDNRDNSADSRLWGLVPEDHIVGKPLFIWLSLNPDKPWFGGKIRWDRLFTSANKG